MPISIRLPPEIESQITGFSSRFGVSKSAVIVRSIQEFLTRHAQPSSFDIYEKAMRSQQKSLPPKPDARPLKSQARQAIERKHAQRSARATQALVAAKKA